LWSVPSLALILAGSATPLSAGRYLAALDALRGDVYVAAYDIASSGAVHEIAQPRLCLESEIDEIAATMEATIIGPARRVAAEPHARGALRLLMQADLGRRVGLEAWEPEYGRLAEAQVKWEAAHGRPLPKS